MTETHTPPMSDRDRLAEFAWERLAGPGSVGTAAAEIRYSADRVADIAVAAGWRPPARVITDPAELGSLPVGAVVRYGNWIEQQRGPGEWEAPGIEGFSRTATVFAAAAAEGAQITVLHIPTQEADR